MRTNVDRILGQRFGRRDFLRYAALAGGAGVLAACRKAATPVAPGPGVERPSIDEEPGELTVFEWAGYELKPLWRPYAREFADQEPNFTFLTSDDQALSKVRAGFRSDLVHPCIGYINDWVNLGVMQPWDPTLLSNFGSLNPAMVKAGQVDGKQYFMPIDWGFSSPMYNADEVEPEEESWNLFYDERYAGKISWWDSLENLITAGYVQGFPDPWDMTDEELDFVKNFLIEKKHVVRNFWSSQTDMDHDFAAGNIWITYAWGGSFTAAKAKGINAVYTEPKEGRLAWVCGFMLFAETENYYHAHEFVDAWASEQTAGWIIPNYAYGHSNTNVDLSEVDPELIEVFKLDDPSALEEPNAHIDRYIPRRQLYNQIWDEVKAA